MASSEPTSTDHAAMASSEPTSTDQVTTTSAVDDNKIDPSAWDYSSSEGDENQEYSDLEDWRMWLKELARHPYDPRIILRHAEQTRHPVERPRRPVRRTRRSDSPIRHPIFRYWVPNQYNEPNAKQKAKDMERATKANPGDTLVTIRFVIHEQRSSLLVTTGASMLCDEGMYNAIMFGYALKKTPPTHFISTRDLRRQDRESYKVFAEERTMGNLAAIAQDPQHLYPQVTIKTLGLYDRAPKPRADGTSYMGWVE